MASRFVSSKWIWIDGKSNEQDEKLYDEDVLHSIKQLKQSFVNNNCNQIVYNDEADEDPELTIKRFVDTLNKPDTTPSTGCSHCSKQIRVEDVSQFMKGQHLAMPGAKKHLSKFYKHHAIVKRVISTYNTVAELELIHFYSVTVYDRLQITKTTEKYDLRKDIIYCIKYEHQRYEPDRVIVRAEMILKESTEDNSRFKEYKWLSCNCEHFATYCVTGIDESLQVQSYVQKIISFLNPTDLSTHTQLRLLFNNIDEIVAWVKNGIGKASNITLGITTSIYLLYCIVMTVHYSKNNQEGKMCRACLKEKLTESWLGLEAFLTTSSISFLFTQAVFPLVSGYISAPLFVLVALLLDKVHSSLPKLRQAFKVDKNKISNLSEVDFGDVISFSYYGFEHVGVVTELNEYDHKVTCVHYALPTLFGTRVVQEETFDLDPSKKTVRLFACNFRDIRPSHEVVNLARKRVGETKWSLVNRSDHLCYWAKFKNNPRYRCDLLVNKEPLKTSSLEDSFIREENVHLMSDINIGDVVKYKKIGIVVGLKSLDGNYGRGFELVMIVYNSFYVFCKEIYRVDLNKDDLTVFIHHPAYCFPMRTRSERALALTDKKGEWWTNCGFISHCIISKQPT